MNICLTGVEKRFRNHAAALTNITLEIPPAHVLGLSGPNGSGKTMLMRIVAGLVRPTAGYVSIDGKRLGRDLEFPPNMGILLEHPAFLPAKTGIQNLTMIASVRGSIDASQIQHWMERAGLNPASKTKYRGYSLGMKQRLGIAAACMEESDLLILDEPTNALDAEGAAMVAQLVEEARLRGATVLISSHDMELLHHVADEILFMGEGRIVRRERMERSGNNA